MDSRSDRHRVLWGLLGSVILICVAAISVLAVCEQPHPRVCTEFYDSAAVFTGAVVAVRGDPPDEPNPGGWYYRVKVERSFRGPSSSFIQVYTGNDSARFPLKKGRRYLLFARDFEGVLNIGCCGNSGFLENSDEAIHRIEEIQNTKTGGEIAGRIGWGESSQFEGVRVLAIGKNQTYKTKVDSKGWFHMKVPEGVYRVRAEAPGGGQYPSFDLTYDNPEHIVVQRGGCPQMQFMPN